MHFIASRRTWIDGFMQRLEKDGLLKAMTDSIRNGKTTYLVSDLSIPGLRHFVYKSRPNVQITLPEFEDPYDDDNEKRRYVLFSGVRLESFLLTRVVRSSQIDHVVSDFA